MHHQDGSYIHSERGKLEIRVRDPEVPLAYGRSQACGPQACIMIMVAKVDPLVFHIFPGLPRLLREPEKEAKPTPLVL